VGFRVVDILTSRLSIRLRKRFLRPYAVGTGGLGGSRLLLAKPLTFMNVSGSVIPRILEENGFSLPEVLVVFDSLDLSPGSCRLRLRGSSGGHKGLESAIRWLGSEEFMRLAVGIGRPPVREEVVEHVLGVPEEQEEAAIEAGVARAAEAVLRLLSEGPEKVMNEVNRKEPAS
jgi:PTH1 family peptidyl-tRNA hydrolase